MSRRTWKGCTAAPVLRRVCCRSLWRVCGGPTGLRYSTQNLGSREASGGTWLQLLPSLACPASRCRQRPVLRRRTHTRGAQRPTDQNGHRRPSPWQGERERPVAAAREGPPALLPRQTTNHRWSRGGRQRRRTRVLPALSFTGDGRSPRGGSVPLPQGTPTPPSGAPGQSPSFRAQHAEPASPRPGVVAGKAADSK